MIKVLTPEEQKAQDARVADVQAAINAAAAKRVADNVVETPEQKKSRENDEARRLEDAKAGFNSNLTPEEVIARDARIATVNADIEAARLKRVADKVVETPAQTATRLENEAFLLRDARGETTPKEKLHIESRNARVKKVQDDIVAAKVIRDANEKKGLVESEGVKLDRLAKEAKDLEEASELNVIEPFFADVNNLEVKKIVDKLNEVIEYLNDSVTKEDE